MPQIGSQDQPVFAEIQEDVSRRRKQPVESHGQQASTMALLNAIAVAANRSSNLLEILSSCVEKICEFTNWDVGHAFVSTGDGSGQMVPTECWYTVGSQYASFKEETERTSFATGIGLVGKALKHGEPCWITDVTTNPHFVRSESASTSGLVGGVAFPVMISDEIVAVLEFFATRSMEPSAELIDILSHAAAQLGQVFERQRSKAALTSQNERFNAALENMSQGLCMYDAEHRLIVYNNRFATMYGLSKNQLALGTAFTQIRDNVVANNAHGDDNVYSNLERLR